MGKRQKVFEMTNGRCFYCGCKLDAGNFHMDHFTAKTHGGKQKNNLVPACPDCNITKSDMTVEQFRVKIANMLTASMQGRMIAKYYGLERKPVKFFFEEVESGAIQNNINEFLDGQ